MPGCVAFEYAELGKLYCFYAYDAEGNSYRILWTNFTGLNEKDQIIVEYVDDIKALSYDEYLDGWTPQYEITATNVRMEKRANENLALHIQIASGANKIYPFGSLLWSEIDNQDGTFTVTTVDKYDIADLINGKTNFPVEDIPTLVLDGRVEYFVLVNGKIEKVYLLTENGNRYTKTETTFNSLSNLGEGTYQQIEMDCLKSVN